MLEVEAAMSRRTEVTTKCDNPDCENKYVGTEHDPKALPGYVRPPFDPWLTGHEVFCTHPSIGRKRVADTSWSTPEWCPFQVLDAAATERARIVAMLRAMAAQRDAEAEAVLARCPDAFATGMGGERLKMIEREHAAIAYHQFADAGNELRRAADRIERGK